MKQGDNEIDVFGELPWFDADVVRKARVIVAGAGALGNEVLKNLALFGIGHIFIVDPDIVEKGNLSRSILFRQSDAEKGVPKVEAAAKMIREINPDVDVEYVRGRLASDVGLSVYRNSDVAVGCLDNRLARLQLNRICMRAGIPWVDGGIEDMTGSVKVFKPGLNCYECQLSDADRNLITARLSCSDIAKRNIASGHVPTTPVIASVIGAVQAQEALKIIHKNKNFDDLCGKIFYYDGLSVETGVFEMQSFSDECPSHEKWNDIIIIKELKTNATVKHTLEILKNKLQTSSVEINLRNDKFVDKVISRENGKIFTPMLPESKIPDYIDDIPELRIQPQNSLNQNVFENINDDFPYKELTLKEIGIPYNDIIQVTTDKGPAYVAIDNN